MCTFSKAVGYHADLLYFYNVSQIFFSSQSPGLPVESASGMRNFLSQKNVYIIRKSERTEELFTHSQRVEKYPSPFFFKSNLSPLAITGLINAPTYIKLALENFLLRPPSRRKSRRLISDSTQTIRWHLREGGKKPATTLNFLNQCKGFPAGAGIYDFRSYRGR